MGRSTRVSWNLVLLFSSALQPSATSPGPAGSSPPASRNRRPSRAGTALDPPGSRAVARPHPLDPPPLRSAALVPPASSAYSIPFLRQQTLYFFSLAYEAPGVPGPLLGGRRCRPLRPHPPPVADGIAAGQFLPLTSRPEPRVVADRGQALVERLPGERFVPPPGVPHAGPVEPAQPHGTGPRPAPG